MNILMHTQIMRKINQVISFDEFSHFKRILIFVLNFKLSPFANSEPEQSRVSNGYVIHKQSHK